MNEENLTKKCLNCLFFNKEKNYCKSIKIQFNENIKIKRCDGFEDNRLQNMINSFNIINSFTPTATTFTYSSSLYTINLRDNIYAYQIVDDNGYNE